MILFNKLFESLRDKGHSHYYPHTKNGIIKLSPQRPDTNTPVTAHTLNILLNILGADDRLNGISGLRAKNREMK